MSHLLPCFALCHALGLWVADAGWLDATAGRLLAGSSLLAALAPTRLRALLLAVGFFGAGVAALGALLDLSRQHPMERVYEARVEATVCELGRSGSSIRMELCECVGVGEEAHAVPARILVLHRWTGPERGWAKALMPGHRLRWHLRLRPLGGRRNPGVIDPELRLRRAGIGARASLVDEGRIVRVIPAGQAPGWSTILWARVDRRVALWRASIATRLDRAGAAGALLASLCIGERGMLPQRARDDFSRLGLAHLLAVSGLHLAMVAGIAYGMARRSLLRFGWLARRVDVRRAALAISLAVAGVYALMCGSGLPVRRAWIFLFAGWLALSVGRRVPASHLLALAAMVVLALEPAALFSVGAQLSFVVSAALLASRFDAPFGDASRVPRALWLLSASTAVAVAASAPLLAAHGMETGMFGLISNIVAIPWTGAVLLPAALASGGVCWVDAGLACDWVLGLAARSASWTLWSVESAAGLWPTGGFTARPAVWALSLAGIAVIGIVRARRLRARLAMTLALCLALRVAPPTAIAPPAPRMVVLDVGQGDAVLVQGMSGQILVDGGMALPGGFDMGERVVGPALAALGVDHLDLVIATHADLDHRGGLGAVLERLPVGELWVPIGGRADADFASLLDMAAARGVPVLERGRGDPTRILGDLRISPLWPGPASEGGSRNDRSLMVRVEAGDRSALLTGDLGIAAERQLLELSAAELRADVLKVGHHGSAGSTSSAFLEAVAPRLAVVSAGCGSRTGLPSSIVLKRLERSVPELAWTGRSGAILISLDGSSNSDSLASMWSAARWCAPQ